MRFGLTLFVISAALLVGPAAFAQKKVDVAGAEARVTTSLELVESLKATNLAAERRLDSLKIQLKESEKITKELQKQIAKQTGQQRVAETKQKAAEAKLRLQMTAAKEAQKREKVAEKAAEKREQIGTKPKK